MRMYKQNNPLPHTLESVQCTWTACEPCGNQEIPQKQDFPYLIDPCSSVSPVQLDSHFSPFTRSNLLVFIVPLKYEYICCCLGLVQTSFLLSHR